MGVPSGERSGGEVLVEVSRYMPDPGRLKEPLVLQACELAFPLHSSLVPAGLLHINTGKPPAHPAL